MKKIIRFFPFLLPIIPFFILLVNFTGCANIIPPGGGPRDSLPPLLVAVTPPDSAINVSTNRINFTFNEYVEVQNIQENVIVSPTPNASPFIDYKLRTVSVRLRDTLEPNTTYSINFGDAIKDINEGNVLKNFTYFFSTGSRIDYNTISGRVLIAETGRVDSTLIVVLHRNLDDSAVANERPRYITRVDGRGNFYFQNLPAGRFAIYAIPNDFSKRYDDKTKLFAFADSPVVITDSTRNINLYAYIDSIKVPVVSSPGTSGRSGRTTTKAETILRYNNSLQAGKQDLLSDLELTFNRPIATFDTSKLVLTTKAFQPIKNAVFRRDTSQTKFILKYPWPAGTDFKVLIAKDAFADSSGLTLPEEDTLSFATKQSEEYGSLKIRFTNLDFSRNPVLQVVENEQVIESSAIVQRDWIRKLFKPGEYSVRILYDANKNGKWDAGSFFGVHRQPEIVLFLDTKLSVRANWDNEKEIRL